MKIRIEYEKEEVDRIVLEAHEKLFGRAPAGEQWSVSGGYGDRTVENIPIREDGPRTESEPADEAVMPPPAHPGGAQHE